MRLTSILLLTSCALCACHAAATASELASVPHTTQGNPVTTKMRHAVLEEERSPLVEAEEQGVLQKLRGLFGEANLPSIPAGGIQESQDSAYARGLLTLYSKLENEFGENLDSVLALAEKHFVGEEDKPLRKLVADLLSRKNDSKRVKTAKNRLRAGDSEDTRLHTLKKPFVGYARLTEKENLLLRSIIGDAKVRLEEAHTKGENFSPAVFRELISLYEKLKTEFGEKKVTSALERAYWDAEKDKALQIDLLTLQSIKDVRNDEETTLILEALTSKDREEKVLPASEDTR